MEYLIAHLFGLNYIGKRYVDALKVECHIFSFHGQDIFYPFSAFDEEYAQEVVSKIILKRIGQNSTVNVQDIKF